MGDCELAEVLVGSCIASVGLLAVGAVAKACPVLHLMHSLCCTGQLLEARFPHDHLVVGNLILLDCSARAQMVEHND